MRKGKVIGHRGAPSIKVENSMESIEEALKLGVDGVEVDVRCTRDGNLIAFHDASLSRILGVDLMVSDVELSEIREMSSERGFYVPTINEVLRMVKDKVMIVLDVKEWRAVDYLIEMLQGYSSSRDVIISSFDHRIPLLVKEEIGGVKAGLILSSRPLSISRIIDKNVDVVFLRRDYADAELIREARGLGLEVYVWVVNSVSEAERFWLLGAHGIITDKPELFA